ncbi:hypothetical protein QBC38DRAFT_489209 [Podospora fimiseda]|uniref:Uncharacterized protein n=1 Tax=Podospora fimiseda TaxID=252190 RepID=A0AAN7BEE6_9PEZI|nr:hypothetical protein QBC38DRAFT_489209 [Podospora fimiseda]
MQSMQNGPQYSIVSPQSLHPCPSMAATSQLPTWVVAVAFHNATATLSQDPDCVRQVNESVEFLAKELESGNVIDGVNRFRWKCRYSYSRI